MLDMDISLMIILFLIGFLAAFIDSVVGGGGLISLPALMFTGLNPSAAVATNKLASTLGALTSTISFYRSGKMDIHAVKHLFPFSFIASMVGAWTVHLMNPAILKPLMLILLAAVAIYTIFKKDWGSISTYQKLTKKKSIAFFLLVIIIGCYDGFLGPGTGSFLIFSFLLIGFDFLKAAGNAKFLNFASNIGALIMFIFLHQINYHYGIAMGIGQIFGATCGSKFAIKQGTGYVRVLFIIVTLLLLAKNTYDYFIGLK